MAPQKLTFKFSTDSWDESKEDVGDVTIGRVRTDRTLTGDLEGKAVACYVMSYYGPKQEQKEGECSKQHASFDGEFVFSGTLKGKTGTFAMRASGMYDGSVDNTWTIVPETASGELKGIKGTGKYFIPADGHKCPVDATLEVEM